MENLTLVAHIPSQLLALIESTAAYEKSSGLRVADGARQFHSPASPYCLSSQQGPPAPPPWRCWLSDSPQDRQRRDRTVRIRRSTGFRPPCRNRLQHLARLPG